MRRFGWFLVAGSIGFLADAAILALLLGLTAMGPFSARFIAIGFAMLATWSFNRTITFGRSRYPLLVEGARYGSVGLASALLNYAVYALVLLAWPTIPPLAALVAASAAAMAFSWGGYARFVFRR